MLGGTRCSSSSTINSASTPSTPPAHSRGHSGARRRDHHRERQRRIRMTTFTAPGRGRMALVRRTPSAPDAARIPTPVHRHDRRRHGPRVRALGIPVATIQMGFVHGQRVPRARTADGRQGPGAPAEAGPVARGAPASGVPPPREGARATHWRPASGTRTPRAGLPSSGASGSTVTARCRPSTRPRSPTSSSRPTHVRASTTSSRATRCTSSCTPRTCSPPACCWHGPRTGASTTGA